MAVPFWSKPASYSLLLKLLLKLFVIIQDGFAMPNRLILMK